MSDEVVMRRPTEAETLEVGMPSRTEFNIDEEYWVFEIPGKGQIFCSISKENSIAWIIGMHTEQQFRRQGVNRALFTSLCKHVRCVMPGVIVAPFAAKLARMMERVATENCSRIGDYTLDPRESFHE